MKFGQLIEYNMKNIVEKSNTKFGRAATRLSGSFSARFLKKNLSLITFYELTKFHCLFTFTSRDIGQYVYCNMFIAYV